MWLHNRVGGNRGWGQGSAAKVRRKFIPKEVSEWKEENKGEYQGKAMHQGKLILFLWSARAKSPYRTHVLHICPSARTEENTSSRVIEPVHMQHSEF